MTVTAYPELSTPVHDPFRGMAVRGKPRALPFPEARLRQAGVSDEVLARVRDLFDNDADDEQRKLFASSVAQLSDEDVATFAADLGRRTYSTDGRTIKQIEDDLVADPELLPYALASEQGLDRPRVTLVAELERQTAELADAKANTDSSDAGNGPTATQPTTTDDGDAGEQIAPTVPEGTPAGPDGTPVPTELPPGASPADQPHPPLTEGDAQEQGNDVREGGQETPEAAPEGETPTDPQNGSEGRTAPIEL